MNHLNELIALELGWRDLRPAMEGFSLVNPTGRPTGIPPGELRTYVPNWAGSLDLMHELEIVLRHDEIDWEHYVEALADIIGIPARGRLVHATAEQKALAWLKVKGVEV